VLATSEATRLIVQIPLRTERRTYISYDPAPLPTFEPNLGKFIQIRAGSIVRYEKLSSSFFGTSQGILYVL
jgi:hypothetical protein